MSIYVLYHASCHDGFGAAFAAWKKFGDGAKYVAVNDRATYPEFIPEGSELYLLDFAFKKDVIAVLREKMSRVTILDHHATVRMDLEGQPDTIFDMDRSGAVIAWQYFHEEKVPLFLKYIQDRDLYQNFLPFTREITMYNFSLPFDFHIWDETYEMFALIEEELGGMQETSLPVITGGILLNYRRSLFTNMIDRLFQWKIIAGHRVPVINVPREFGTEICAELLSMYPEAAFAGYFYETKKGVEWGLRSRDFDVGMVAKALGGGGHKCSAGFFREGKTEDEITLPES